MNLPNSWIEIEGSTHDLVGLRRLFNEIEVGIRVDTSVSSYVDGVLVVAKSVGRGSARLIGEKIDEWLLPADSARFAEALVTPHLKALNGHCRLLDPNFGGVRAVKVGVLEGFNIQVFAFPKPQKNRAGSTLGRHEKQVSSLPARMRLIKSDELCAFVVETLSEPPTWSGIYACFETIKHDPDIGDLVKSKLITKDQNTEFNKAANNITNREEGARHGHTKTNKKLTISEQIELMTLSEAEELHRQVVNRYLDFKTDQYTAFEVCDLMNDAPRFGIHPYRYQL